MALSDLTPDRLTQAKIDQCNQEMLRSQGSLCFAEPLEQEFRRYLKGLHFKGIKIFLLIGLVCWLGFAALDWVRYLSVTQEGVRQAFVFYIFGPRYWVVLFGLFCWWLLQTQRITAQSPSLQWLGFAFIYQIAAVAFVTSNFYITNDMVAAKSSSVILIMVCFLPLGYTFYQALGLALAVYLTDILTGYWMLPPDLLVEHWMICAIVGAALLISGFSTAMREQATRQQFLLRILLRWQAQHDPLTGLSNRRHFEEWANTGFHQARQECQPVALAIIDVDHFKKYNDHYGHQQGDYALQKIARSLQNVANRPLDLAIRLGGEEFAVIAYGETAESLDARLHGFMTELRTLAITHAHSPTASHMTASIGICEVMDGENLESVYQRADQALYVAKTSGRDRVVLWGNLRGPAMPVFGSKY